MANGKNGKRIGGRPTKFDNRMKAQVKAMAELGLTDVQMSDVLGICRQTLNNYMNKDKGFLDTIKKGKDVADEQVKKSLFKRAMGYGYDEITKERVSADGQKRRHQNKEYTLTQKEWENCLKYFGYACAYCGSDDDVRKDHLIPLAKGGDFTKTNIIPACLICNSSKKDRNVDSWYKRQSFYSSSKLKKITDYIAIKRSEPDEIETGVVTVTKIITKQVIPDTLACMYWLNNRKKDEWQARVVYTGSFKTEHTDTKVIKVLNEKDEAGNTIAELIRKKIRESDGLGADKGSGGLPILDKKHTNN